MTEEDASVVINPKDSDWCHICGGRVQLLAEVWYPRNAESAARTRRWQQAGSPPNERPTGDWQSALKNTEYVRICAACADRIGRVARRLESRVEA